jgi:hypothetical protein
MEIGMLWLDDDKKSSLDEKIRKAAAYYLDKYGQKPDICLVNQAMLAEEKKVDAIQVQPANNVLPNHFWVGVKAV